MEVEVEKNRFLDKYVHNRKGVKSMKQSLSPLFVVPCVILNHKTTFHKINEKIVVEAPGKLIRQLIELCDGTRILREIIDTLKDDWDKHDVYGLISELCRHGIVADSRTLSETIWPMIENPSHFPSLLSSTDVAALAEKAKQRHKNGPPEEIYKVQLSAFGQLLEKRRSVRSFSGEVIDLQSIIQILWAAYGEVNAPTKNFSRRTVPSAGALYPLMISIILFEKTGNLQPGIYQVWMGKPQTVGFKYVSADIMRFVRSFADPLMFNDSHGVVVISGNFCTTGEKYGNRSTLFTVLEAGYAAQNVHLAALELKVATVEIGGFIDQLLTETLVLPRHFRPLTTIIFGREKGADESVQVSKPKIETYWAVPLAGKYRLPFTMAFARVSSKTNKDWSCGRAVLPRLAYIKAVAESKEWAACGCIPDTLIQARFSDLDVAIDPRTIIRFRPVQYRLNGFPFKPFDDRKKYAWAEGIDELQGSKTLVLADCVYFPYYPKTPWYAHANSSGVAAHPERQQAIKNGVLELVERDSFMIAYLAKLTFPTVSEKSLPEKIQERISSLRKNGFKVWIKDYSLDLAPVVFVFAQNEELVFTTCAGCSDFNTEEALDHALMEVESSVLYRLANGPLKPIKLSKVQFPSDHGRLYEQRQFFQKADFLVRSRNLIAFREVGKDVAQSWQELLDRFVAKKWSLITVPLNLTKELGGNDGLHIVRSIVPGMVPISFGNREEPCGMERIHVVAKEIGGISVSYRDMPKFPHPYT